MEYIKATLQSGGTVYGLQTYFPYTDKIFFSNIDALLKDEEYFNNIINQFIKLYNNEIVFDYKEIRKHKCIVPVIYKGSNKFTKINKKIAKTLSTKLDMEYKENVFSSIFDKPDIRDAYTTKSKIDAIIEDRLIINNSIIFVDCCCSTGNIFNAINIACIKKIKRQDFIIDPFLDEEDNYNFEEINDENDYDDICITFEEDEDILQQNKLIEDNPAFSMLGNEKSFASSVIFKNKFEEDHYNFTFLSFGIRYNAVDINNSKIVEIINSNNILINENQNDNYIVKIKKLFDDKDIKIDFNNHFILGIGENGYGKSTAMKIAVFALDNFDTKYKSLVPFYFDEIEVYKMKKIRDNYFDETLEVPVYDYESISVGDLIYCYKYGYGKVLKLKNKGATIKFENEMEEKNMHISFLRIIKNGNIVKKKYLVDFLDADGIVFYKQIVEEGSCIDFSILDILGIKIEHRFLEQIYFNDFYEGQRSIIFTNYTMSEHDKELLINTIDNECFLEYKIKYLDLLPIRKNIQADDNICVFLNAITDDEYCTICRKIINQDKSIEANYTEMYLKYKLKLDFDVLHKYLSNILLKDYICKNDLSFIDSNKFTYFDCTTSRKLISKKINDIVSINFETYEEDSYDYDESFYDDLEYYNANDFEPDFYEQEQDFTDQYYNEDNEYYDKEWVEMDSEEQERFRDEMSSTYDPEDYDDEYTDLDRYLDRLEDMDYDEYDSYDNEDYDYDAEIERKYNEQFIDENTDYYYKDNKLFDRRVKKEYINLTTNEKSRIILKDENDIYDILWNLNSYERWKSKRNKDLVNFNSLNIKISDVIRNLYVEFPNKTLFNSYLNRILEIENSKGFYYIVEGKKAYKTIKSKNFDKLFDNINKKEYSELYNKIFVLEFDVIKYGIYSLLRDSDKEIFSQIINRIRINGLNDSKDLLILLYVNELLEEFKKNVYSLDTVLLEKLLNKYFENKKVHVYSDNLLITDINGKDVPVDKLSTGEKNLIILFLLALTKEEGTLILDEPDLSMSVDWQRKLIPDLIKVCKCNLVVVSQSPLLIQKNGLSNYVIRFDDSISLSNKEGDDNE